MSEQKKSPENTTENNLIEQVTSEFRKAEKDSVKQKLKDLLGKKNEHERSIRQLDVQIKKVIDDFEAGV